MLVESGLVLEVLPDGTARVSVERSDACARCGACHKSEGQTMVALARNEAGASAGDLVELALPTGVFLPAVFMVFGMPLALAAALAALGWLVGKTLDRRVAVFAAAGGAACGMFLAGLILRWHDRRSGGRYVPVITTILRRAGEGTCQ